MPESQLLSLQVENLGPIKEAHLEFSGGLNVLTGETGAGKTLLVGALTLCAGASDDRGLRHTGPLTVSTVFLRGDEEISLSRRDDGSARLRSFLDGVASSAAALRTAASSVLSIFGQSASQRLRSPSEYVRLIDQFGGVDDSRLRRARSDLRDVELELVALGGDERSREKDVSYLRARLAEIDRVAPTSATELDDVVEQIKSHELLRSSFETIVESSHLLASDDGQSASSLLAEAVRRLSSGEGFTPLVDRLRAVSEEITDVARTLVAVHEGGLPDEAEVERLNVRARDLHQLARTFGGTLESALAEGTAARAELSRLDASAVRARDAEIRGMELAAIIGAEETRVRAHREAAALAFTRAVQSHFAEVALPRAELSATVDGPDGAVISLLFSPDGRRFPGPLHQLASGGELARVLLALSLESVATDVVAVFDEVDAGIGGAVAERIGDCLRALSQRQQVIVVTHLATVAALADRHFVVAGSTESSAYATVRQVSGDERVSEIARMLAGESAPDAARALAAELLAPSAG